MIPILRFLKFPYVLLIIGVQLCIRYGFFEPFRPYGVAITLNGFGVFLEVAATFAIGIAGVLGMALYTYDTPQLPSNLSVKMANRLFVILNCIGVAIGFYLANLIGKPIFAILFILGSIGFYMYATYLKEILIVKNCIVPLLIALAIIIPGLFDLLPAITETNQSIQKVCFSIVLDYAIFAFGLTLLWSIIRDLPNLSKDHKHGIQSLAVVLGQQRTYKIIGVLALLLSVGVTYYIYAYLFTSMKGTLFALFGIVAPLLYVTIRSWTTDADKRIASFPIVLTIISGIAAISFWTYQYILL